MRTFPVYNFSEVEQQSYGTAHRIRRARLWLDMHNLFVNVDLQDAPYLNMFMVHELSGSRKKARRFSSTQNVLEKIITLITLITLRTRRSFSTFLLNVSAMSSFRIHVITVSFNIVNYARKTVITFDRGMK